MKLEKYLASTVVLLLLLTSACSGDSDSGLNERFPARRPPLELAFSTPPIDLPGTAARFVADLPYGVGERNRLDIYLPDCDEPTPLVIYTHGGGFTGGDKSESYQSNAGTIREFLQACVAYASINYFLLTIPEAGGDLDQAAAQGGVLTSLHDAARALQFLRFHYQSLHLDPDNVAVYGVSAGAGASLWLGTHDDLADPDNPDPVLRESTRVSAVGALATQATYDLLRWEEILLPFTQLIEDYLGGTDIVTVAAAVGATDYMLTFLGVGSVDEIYGEENAAYRADIDMLGLMDAGDAPLYVRNYDVGFDDLLNTLLHHGLHALAVKSRADEVGLNCVAYSEDPLYSLEDPSGEGLESFLLRHIR